MPRIVYVEERHFDKELQEDTPAYQRVKAVARAAIEEFGSDIYVNVPVARPGVMVIGISKVRAARVTGCYDFFAKGLMEGDGADTTPFSITFFGVPGRIKAHA